MTWRLKLGLSGNVKGEMCTLTVGTDHVFGFNDFFLAIVIDRNL
jgi:hypothetical protein